MICIYAESHLSTFTFILYTCIWIPLRHITQSLVKIFAFVLNPHHQHQLLEETPSCCNLDLPISRFHSLECSSNRNKGEEEEEMCSICLVEFEMQDLVNKLGRCGHTFHVECMEKWLETCRFSCPLCRSLLLHHSTSPCKTWPHS